MKASACKNDRWMSDEYVYVQDAISCNLDAVEREHVNPTESDDMETEIREISSMQ